MKIDLGNYKYCEKDTLEELGKICDRKSVWSGDQVKVNGTLFRTERGNYIFYGRVYDVMQAKNVVFGWKLLEQSQVRQYLELCDTVNDNNKWELLDYEEV